jgi:beta-lactam-binding protein with PASTA domain/tRNA A-37 threonylcarbamoyl transferase component Bud32
VQLAQDTVVAGRYRLIGRLGSGGMADVWCADDTMLNRRVALKFLHERFAQDEQFVERFRREASAAAGLQHQNVVGVFDRGTYDGTHYIAMEFVEGASLKDLIDRGLSVPEAVEIVRQVLAGARYAHARGIVHRDLKPQNVLVDSEGRARVADFGIARAGVSEITQTGSVLGTAQYLSPEQAQGLPVTAVSDIYSIGVMLYEALTGKVPFEADSPVTVALKQVSERPRPPSELNPAVSRALDAVVLKALAKDPANRFASAQEFLDALDAAEADPSGAALGDTAAYAAVAAAAGTPPPEPPPPPEGPPERQGFFTPARLAVLALLLLALAAVIAYALTRPDRVNVPTVLDQPRAKAEATLEAAGFEVDVTSVPSDTPRGIVLEQDPLAGTEVDEGSTVTLTVSLGPGTVVVPDVVGQPKARAAKTLEEKGLRVRDKRKPSRSVRAGLVIATQPPADREIERHSVVTLVVSAGPKLVQVPSVVGEQQDAAETALRDAGLTPVVERRNSDAPDGQVIAQDPVAGTTVKPDAEVTVAVSKGLAAAVVPNVVGESEDAAQADIEGAGLSARVVRRTTSDQSEDGQVLDQSPSAGRRLPRGEAVTIFVGKFKAPPTTTTTTTTTPTTTTPTTTTP